jgi:hypothetical protein
LATSKPSNNKPLFINFHNIPIYMRFWVSSIYGLGSNVASNPDHIAQNLRMICEYRTGKDVGGSYHGQI